MAGTRLLVKVRGDGAAFAAAARTAFGAAAVEIEPILSVPASAGGPALGPASGSTWLRVAVAMDERVSIDQRPLRRGHCRRAFRTARL
jgi:hypothetical protein